MTTREVADLDAGRVIVVLPVAAIESHGPHLPLAVDACINEGIIARALELAPAALPLSVLPMLSVGKSDEHDGFAGTLTARAETLLALWAEIGESVARAGVRKILIFNSHGGQPQVAEIVAGELRRRFDMLAVSVNWFDFGLPDNLFPETELRHGIHGGAVETSLMLHLRPDLVRLDLAGNFRSRGEDMAGRWRHLSVDGPGRLAWRTEDLNAEGALGDATLASADKGRAILEHAATKLIELLTEIDQASANFGPAPQ